jgi:hypothetical protein
MNLDRRTKTFERLVFQGYQTGSNITQGGRWSSRGSPVLPRSQTTASPRGRSHYFLPLTVLHTNRSCSSSSVLEMTRVSRDGPVRDPTRRPAGVNRRPYLARVTDKLEDLVDELNWLHLAYKAVAYSYLAFVLWLISFILPFPSNWSRPQQSDRVPIVYQDLKKCVCSETATLGNRD